MIGIVGPADSVGFATQIAADGGFSNLIVPGIYRHADEAVELAKSLEASCAVVVFTGQAPYMLAGPELTDAEAQFISHSGADLYRCIARVLIERGGVLPPVAVDSIDEATVRNAFADLGLPRPEAHPLGSPDDLTAPADVEEILAFHRAALAEGRAVAVLTCLAEVHAALLAEGVQVWRIEHTAGTVADALQRARLSHDLIRSREEQLAVALFAPDRVRLSELDVFEREVVRMRLHRELLEVARRNGGRLTALEGGLFSVAMSRLTLDDDLDGGFAEAWPLEVAVDGLALNVGVGVANTFEHAEALARGALDGAQRTGNAQVRFPDGRMVDVPPTRRAGA
ncbi:hypothetical protein [Microbacterium resistens]